MSAVNADSVVLWLRLLFIASRDDVIVFGGTGN